MSHALLESITEHFAELDDPRRQTANRRHEFVDILTVALCAVIGGANHWTTVVTFAEAKEPWFRRFLRLPNGIPSHDTFSDVFAKIDPDTFEAGFVAWVTALAGTLPGAPVVAVDYRATNNLGLARVSRPEELPLRPLSEPGVNLSIHRAPIVPTVNAPRPHQ